MATRVCALLGNGAYLFILLSLSMFWFMVCGAQTWMTVFLEKAVGVSDDSAELYVIISSLTTPILGAGVGGALFT